MIEVRRIAEGDPLDFEVVIREGGGETRHRVTMLRETYNQLSVGQHTQSVASRRRSVSCSTASRRSRFSGISM
jgi:hypothetical protein